MSWIIPLAGVFFIFMVLPILFMGAPFMPSYRKKNNLNLDSIFDLLKKENIRKFIDLGSGDGRVVIDFARAGFESHGIEINPILVWWSKREINKSGIKNAKIILGNMWKINLKDFDAVFIFHFKTANKYLIEKFHKELKHGSIVISTGFSLPGLELIKKEGVFWIYRV